LLASEWRSTAPDTWVYKLRPNVKFHNGETLTSRAVVEFLTFVTSTDDGKKTSVGQIINGQARVTSARALDDLSVEIKTAGANPIFERTISRFWVPEPKARAEMPKDAYNRNPVGTGPFKVVNWGPNGADYEAVNGGPRVSKIRKLQGLAIPETAARRSAIISDQVDIAIGLGMDDIAIVQGAGHVMYSAPRPTVMTLKLFQTSKENHPFSDQRVRLAANLALDRESMVKHIMKGMASAASQCAFPGVVGYNPNVKPYPFDPDRAKRLLAEAGHPNGFEATIEAVLPSSFAGNDDIYQMVAQQWNAIGIRTKLEGLTLPNWLQRWFPPPEATTLGFKGPFQNNCNLFNLDGLDSFDIQSCKKKPAYYCDQKEQALIDQAEREMDTKKREALIQQLHAANADNAAQIFLIQLVDLVGLNKRVQNFSFDMMRPNYHEMTLAR
jgi:peptide/nickel transport system substrate-binding protein